MLFCGAEGAVKFFLPPIDEGHCPHQIFEGGHCPPSISKFWALPPHQKFELSVPGVTPQRGRGYFYRPGVKKLGVPPRDAEFKFLMGGIAQNFEIDGGQCPLQKFDGGQKKFSRRLRRRKNSPIHPKTHFLLHF